MVEGLNDCSVIRRDVICDNQTLYRAFLLPLQQIFQNLPALLKAHEISIFPSVKSEPILLFLCSGYHCSTPFTLCVFKDMYFFLQGIHVNEPFGFASPSLYTPPGLHVRWSTAREGQPRRLRSLSLERTLR